VTRMGYRVRHCVNKLKVTVQQGVPGDGLKEALFSEEEAFKHLEDTRWAGEEPGPCRTVNG
jgi:hypothetical protein